MLEPVWSCGPVWPIWLVDLLDIGDRDEEQEEEEENEFDFDDFSESDGEWWSNNYHVEAYEGLTRVSSEISFWFAVFL